MIPSKAQLTGALIAAVVTIAVMHFFKPARDFANGV